MEPRPDPIKRLSARQRDVLRLVAEGLTNQEIGERLGVRVSAVNTHLCRTFEKLGALNRAHAAAMFARSGRRGAW